MHAEECYTKTLDFKDMSLRSSRRISQKKPRRKEWKIGE